MKNKKFLITILGSILTSALLTLFVLQSVTLSQKKFATETVSIRSVGQSIVGQGEVHSAQEAVLHFQTPGKLVYLPFKEGDTVYAGQTVAQLDTFPLQEQLKQSLNNYRSTRDVFDQTQNNISNSITQNQQKANLLGKNLGMPTVNALNADDNLNNTVNTIVQRIADEAQAGLDNSVITVELANYALQLASLQAPFNGVLMHEDVTSANQNITSATSFYIADPTQLIFRATVSSHDIDFITVGSPATVAIVDSENKILGSVTKIYPQRITTAANDDVYQVEIAADGLIGAKLGQVGTVSIVSSNTKPTAVVPTWTIIDHNYVWVLQNNKPVLKRVTVGSSRSDATEVYAGLHDGDKVIVNPQAIAAERYIAL